MDTISKKKRSWNMSRIRSRDTKPEIAVRRLLHEIGIRFRLHVRKLPGHPDIVLSRRRTVVFVHGCFWHRHQGCKYAYFPKSRKIFWNNKFNANLKRDRLQEAELKRQGWRVIVVWECQLRKPDKVRTRLENACRKRLSTNQGLILS